MSSQTFILENRFVRRVLTIENKESIRTTSFVNKDTGAEYAREECGCEFLIGINGETVFGYKKSAVHVVDGNLQKQGLQLKFESADPSVGNTMRFVFKIEQIDARLAVCYAIMPDLPMIQKWIEVTAGSQELVIDKLFFEVLNAYPGNLPDVKFFTKHGQHSDNRMFVTRGFDDVLQIHNTVSNDGWFVANTAPGPLNRFLVYPHWTDTSISAGYVTDATPFRKYLAPGETFISHRAITMPYRGEAHSSGIRNRFRACLRTCLPGYIRDDFMYCTWIPFLKNISEPLISELATHAAELGITTFVLDDGWFTDPQWKVNHQKFPNGLEAVSQKIRSLGMRFGLWFNIGTDYGASGERAEDNATEADRSFKYAGFVPGHPSKCLASQHRERIAEKLCELAERYHVGYFKLDFSSIISPYGVLATGCHSRNHAWHRDSLDAVLEQYAALDQIRQQVKSRFPDLILDFSFESFGTDHPNVAALQVSELHHASNLNTHNEQLCTARDIRNTLYRFATLMPPERIMGSLICLEGDHFLENLLSSLAGAPLMAGDIRKLSASHKQQIRHILQKIKSLTDDGPLTEFVKLRGDKFIRACDWDGFARFRPDGAGIVCLFQNESCETPTLQIDLPFPGNVILHDLFCEENVVRTDTRALQSGLRIAWNPQRRYHLFCFV